MNQEQVKQQIEKISSFDKNELINYTQRLYLAKEDIEEKAFVFIANATDLQMANLMEITTLSPMAVYSEFKEGDYDA